MTLPAPVLASIDALNQPLRFLLILREVSHVDGGEQYEDSLFPIGDHMDSGRHEVPYFAHLEPVVQLIETTFVPRYDETIKVIRDGNDIVWLSEELNIPLTMPFGSWTRPQELSSYRTWLNFGYDHQSKEVNWSPAGVGNKLVQSDQFPMALECSRKSDQKAYVVTVNNLQALAAYIAEEDLIFSLSWSTHRPSWEDGSRSLWYSYQWEDGEDCMALIVKRYV